MPRKNLLPSYLSSQAWVDLCDAIDHVFGTEIDKPIDNLGRLREAWLFNSETDSRSISGQLISPDTMDEFERTVLVRQLNTLGFSIRNPDGLTTAQLTRLVRQISVYWYSKGTQDLASFLSYTLDTDIHMTRMWTQDYVTFYPEGDPHIGTPIYDTTTVATPVANFAVDFGGTATSPPITDFVVNPEVGPVPLNVQFTDESYGEIPPDIILGPAPLQVDFTDLSTVKTGGSWYPTTHTTVEVDLGSLPQSMDLKIFSELFADLANYPLVLYYIITTSDVFMHTTAGDYVSVSLVDLVVDNESIANFDLGDADITPALNGGRFTPIGFTQIYGPGGRDFQYPPPIKANFTSDVVLGMAPLTVNFTDTSTGPRSMWGWYFTQTTAPEATDQNPSFIFTQPGTYDVGMLTSGFFGSDYINKQRYITVSPPHPAALLRLLDRSTSQQFLSSFPLTPADITSARGGGGYTPIQPIAIQGHGGSGYVPPPTRPQASFSADVVTGNPPLVVQFTDLSSGTPTSWSWSFDDSMVVMSTVQNPSFTFTEAGSYNVTLTATNSNGSGSITKTNFVVVADPFGPSVVLYIPGQGAEGVTAITEFDGYPVNSVGYPRYTTAVQKFGSSINMYDGNISVPYRPELDIAGSVFTLEQWVYLEDLSNPYYIADFGYESGVAQEFTVLPDGSIQMYDRITTEVIVSDIQIPLNTWSYVYISWDGFYLQFRIGIEVSYPYPWGGPTAIGNKINFGSYPLA